MKPIAWINGAASGIGEAVAKEMHARGYRLILSSFRNDEFDLGWLYIKRLESLNLAKVRKRSISSAKYTYHRDKKCIN